MQILQHKLMYDKIFNSLGDFEVYVKNLSPVKVAKSGKCKYYNMQLQTKEKEYRGISYKLECHRQFMDAELQRSPLKLRKVALKKSKYHEESEEIEIGSGSKVGSTDVTFPYNPRMTAEGNDEKIEPVTNISDILTTKKDSEIVSVLVHLALKDMPKVSVTSKFHANPVHKKDIQANDATGVIKSTLWEEQIETVSTDGTYKITNAMVKEYPPGVLSLSVSSKSTITKLQDTITPSTTSLHDFIINQYVFPPQSVTAIKLYECIRCGDTFDVDPTKALIVKCSLCNAAAKKEKFPVKWQATLIFTTSTEISLKHSLISKYFAMKDLQVPNDEEELVLQLLSDDTTIAVCNNRDICYSFKK